jgi:septal ring factor EnvC (AmiA/AmiB activator)
MRKAFDANVPKLKPRLRAAAGEAGADTNLPRPSPASNPKASIEALGTATLSARAPLTPALSPRAHSHRGVEGAGGEGEWVSEAAPPSFSAPPPPDRAERAATSHAPVAAPPADRKERLDRIKRRVAEAAKPAARIEPVPADPARAAESVLALLRELEAELASARGREDALRGDLDETRRELGRAAGEARAASERLGDSERQLEEKRTVLAELLGEMNALEAERDEAVRRAQALAALDEERTRTLEDVSRRAEEEARLRAEREAEVERLSEELRAGGADAARLRAALTEVTRERDALGTDLDETTRERDELANAKRALEQVHAALAQARARLG